MMKIPLKAKMSNAAEPKNGAGQSIWNFMMQTFGMSETRQTASVQIGTKGVPRRVTTSS
jgi:hypothetical protein